jgi:hypothetical protein
MATYVIKKERTITRQAGDDNEVSFILPQVFPADEVALRFGIFYNVSNNREPLLVLTQDEAYNEEQTVTFPIHKDDTANKKGPFRWELEVTHEGKTHTIGRGDFVLTPKLLS